MTQKVASIFEVIKGEIGTGKKSENLRALIEKLETAVQDGDDDRSPDWLEMDELQVYALLFHYVERSLLEPSAVEWIEGHLPAIASAASQRLQAIFDKYKDVVWDYQYHLQKDADEEREQNRPQLDPATKAKIAFQVASNAINSVAEKYPGIAEEIRAVMEKVRPREIEAQQEETPTEH